MIFWILFILELLILFVTSRIIFQDIFYFSYKIFRKERIAVLPIFILFFPGIVIHEFSHLIMAEVLFVKTGHMEIAPKIENGLLRLGSLQVRKTDPFRQLMIGVAPVIIGSLVIFSVIFFFFQRINFFEILSTPTNLLFVILLLWTIFFTTNTMFSSKKDVEGVVGLLIALAFLAIVLVLTLIILKVNFVGLIVGLLEERSVVEFVKLIVFFFSIPVAINLIIFGAGRLLRRSF